MQKCGNRHLRDLPRLGMMVKLTDVIRIFRYINIAIYVLVIALTLVLSIYALYIVFHNFSMIQSNLTDVAILSTLSELFLVILALEVIEMFLTYIESSRIRVDLVIAIVLTAIAREAMVVFTNLTSLTLTEGALLISMIIALSVSYWLVLRAERLAS